MKKKLFVMFFLFTMLINAVCYADANSKNIKDKLEKQNNIIFEILKKSKKEDSTNELKEIIDKFYETNKNIEGTMVDAKDIKNKIKGFAFYLSIVARKYMIPAYIIIFFVCVFGIAFYNTKNLKKKKHFILILIGTTIFTLVVINLPVIILYFQYNKISDITTEENLSNVLFGLINFMKTNSYPIAIIMYFYGIINSILGRKDIARYELSKYLKKGAITILLTFNLLPLVIQYLL